MIFLILLPRHMIRRDKGEFKTVKGGGGGGGGGRKLVYWFKHRQLIVDTGSSIQTPVLHVTWSVRKHLRNFYANMKILHCELVQLSLRILLFSERGEIISV